MGGEGKGGLGGGGFKHYPIPGENLPWLDEQSKGPIGGGAELVSGFRSGARLAGRGAAVACVLMTVLRLKRETDEGCLVASRSPRSLGIWHRARHGTRRCGLIPLQI